MSYMMMLLDDDVTGLLDEMECTHRFGLACLVNTLTHTHAHAHAHTLNKLRCVNVLLGEKVKKAHLNKRNVQVNSASTLSVSPPDSLSPSLCSIGR